MPPKAAAPPSQRVAPHMGHICLHKSYIEFIHATKAKPQRLHCDKTRTPTWPACHQVESSTLQLASSSCVPANAVSSRLALDQFFAFENS